MSKGITFKAMDDAKLGTCEHGFVESKCTKCGDIEIRQYREYMKECKEGILRKFQEIEELKIIIRQCEDAIKEYYHVHE